MQSVLFVTKQVFQILIYYLAGYMIIHRHIMSITLQILTAKWLKRSVLRSVLFDEPSSLGGLPQ